MNELADYRRAIGSFLPNRGPRGRRKWQPCCRPKSTTRELLTIALAGLLWITAIYITTDINLQLLKNSPPVPVSGLFAHFHSLPCQLVEKLGSSELWGNGGLPGLFEAHMSIESWQNRLTWALVSYGVHKLFLALKIRKAGDIELNPGPNPSQPEKALDKTPRGRRATRAKTREEAGTSQMSRLAQVGEIQTQTQGTGYGSGAVGGTSVSRMHLTPEPAKKDRYNTPISKELEEAEQSTQDENNQLKDLKRADLVTSTPKKQEGGVGVSEQEDEMAPTQIPTSTETGQSQNHSGSGLESEGSGESELLEEPGGLDTTQKEDEEPGERLDSLGPSDDVVSINIENNYPSQNSSNTGPLTETVTPSSQQAVFTSEGGNPEKADKRSVGESRGNTTPITTTTTTTTRHITTPAASMSEVTAQRSQSDEERGGAKRKQSNLKMGQSSTFFSQFPGHTCDFDRKGKPHPINQEADCAEGYRPNTTDNDIGSDSDRPFAHGTDIVSSGNEEAVFTQSFDNPHRPNSHRNGSGRLAEPMPNNASGPDMDNNVEAMLRRRTGVSVSENVNASGSLSHDSRGENGNERKRRNGSGGHAGSSHVHKHPHRHARSQANNAPQDQSHIYPSSQPHNHSHSHSHPNSHPHSQSQQNHHMQLFQQQMHQQQSQPQSHYQQSQYAYPPHMCGGGQRERDKVSNPGYSNAGMYTHSYDAMNEYYNERRGRDNNNPQEMSMANALGLIMNKMESQQEELQKQMQVNQSITERGIENTQKRISHMHRDIQDIQQEVRETNIEVQQNKEEIKQLQERQSKLEQQQDSAIAKTHSELEKAQEEIKQMRQSLEYMDEAMEARDEEMDELQDELMEARHNLNRVEAHNRRGNIKIYGIPEHKGEGKESCDEAAMKLFNDYMPGHDWDVDQVERAHRLGQYKEGGRGRPILVKMANPQDTFYILGNKKARENMKKDNIHISQDLTRDQQDILKQEKDKGNLAYFVAGKLVIKEGEGKFSNRDSSRGRRRVRGRDSDRNRDSESGSYSGKRNRQGSAIHTEQSRTESGSRTRTNLGSDQGSPQRSNRPWRFGSNYRRSPAKRDRGENKAEGDGNAFKIPEGPAFRANARPAHRNPYRYMSRSASRHTRNSSPAERKKNSTHGNNQTSGQNSGVASPSNSPNNSPTTSRAGSRQGSRHSSRHSSRGANPQRASNSPQETREEPVQQPQLEEIGDRLRQLSEETPSKHKSASHPQAPHTSGVANWQSPKLKRPGRGNDKHDDVSSQPLKTPVNPPKKLASNAKEGQNCSTTGTESNPIHFDSDSDTTSPSTSHPIKRQRLTYRRFGSRAGREVEKGKEKEEGPARSSSLNNLEQPKDHRPSRPRARIYSGRRFRSQTWKRPNTSSTETQNVSSVATHSSLATPKSGSMEKNQATQAKAKEDRLRNNSNAPPDSPTPGLAKKAEGKIIKSKHGKPTEQEMPRSNDKTLQGNPTKHCNSPAHKKGNLSPTTNMTGQVNTQSPMEISPPSPQTPQNNNPSYPRGSRKQGSWGEQERTKNMRSSLEKENEDEGKQGGAKTWKMIDDGIEQHSSDSSGHSTSASKLDKDKARTSLDNSLNSGDKTQVDNDESVYSSIWEPPTQTSPQCSSKEGCSPTTGPSKKNSTTTGKCMGNKERENNKSDNDSTATAGTLSDKAPEPENDGWQSVIYRRTLRREQKQKSQTVKPTPPESGKPQQERGRNKAKKKNANARGGGQNEKDPKSRKENTKADNENKATTQMRQETETTAGTVTTTEQISLQERVNIALATAASREESRSQSNSRQAYLTPEGTVVRKLQNSAKKGGRGKTTDNKKNDSLEKTHGKTGAQRQ